MIRRTLFALAAVAFIAWTVPAFAEDAKPGTHEGKVVKVALRNGSEDGTFLPERLIQSGYKLRMFKEEEIDLEDVFMGITKGITN